MSSVAAVIPARNAAGHIAACVEALLGAGLSPQRIVVVDDASTDATARIASDRGARVLRRSTCGGAALARNQGVLETGDAEFILFVDADVIVTPDAVDCLVACLAQQPGVAAAFGSYDDAPTDARVPSAYRNLLHHHVHQGARAKASTFWTGFGLIRRDVFAELGGFDLSDRFRPIEDIELGGRIVRSGRAIRLVPEALCKHAKSWTVGSMIRSDVFDRAVPWSRIILASRSIPNDLNVGSRQRLNATVSVAGLLCLAGSVLFTPLLLGVAGAAACVVSLDRGLFAMLARRRGGFFALACVPLHLTHYLCAVAGVAIAVLAVAFEVLPWRRGFGRPLAPQRVPVVLKA